MKLSEAMMLGATIHDMDPTNWDSCLIGVSVRAAGSKHPNFDNNEARVRWPWLGRCLPIPQDIKRYIFHHHNIKATSIITSIEEIISYYAHLVALHVVTLEHVVDWVRMVEQEQEPEYIPEAPQYADAPEHQLV